MRVRAWTSASAFLLVVFTGEASLPTAALAKDSEHAPGALSISMMPFDRVARALGRSFRCGCRKFTWVACPCRRSGMVAGSRAAQGSVDKPLTPYDTESTDFTIHKHREILAAGLTESDVVKIRAAGYRLLGARTSELLDTSLHRVAVPSRLTLQRALAELRNLQPQRHFVANDLYRAIAAHYDVAAKPCGSDCRSLAGTGWDDRYARCAAGARIGVIDTGVDKAHPALQTSRLLVLTTRSNDRRLSGQRHGTGVVSLLIGERGAGMPPLTAGATVVAVDAFHARPDGDAADTFDLVAALDALVASNVTTINLSLVGPDNPILRAAIERIGVRGILTVAAVSPRGGDRQALYPAFYPGVVAVLPTRDGAISTATKGAGPIFAAPGSELTVAVPGGSYARAEGASFAAPFVTAAMAMARQLVNDRDQAIRLIAAGSQDLGTIGRDGPSHRRLVHFSALPGC